MIRFIKVFLLLMFIASPIYAEIKILPLGDSITANVTTHSYRYYLWNLLKDNGYNVNLVGSVQNQTYEGFDPDHEGHSGWRADQIASGLSSWLSSYTPDIVLLHIGHNDIFQGQTPANVISDTEDIIDALQADNANVTILLAQIILPDWEETNYSAINTLLPAVATKKTTATSSVIIVNQNENFDCSVDCWDNVHPNDGGNLKIAQQWYKSIVSLLSPNSGLAPPQELKIVSSSSGQ